MLPPAPTVPVPAAVRSILFEAEPDAPLFRHRNGFMALLRYRQLELELRIVYWRGMGRPPLRLV